MGLGDIYQEHLIGVADFLEDAQARRVRTLACGSSKQLSKLFQMFYHKLELQHGILLDGKDGFSEVIYGKLKKLGSPEKVFVLASSTEVKVEMDLKEALDKTIGHDSGTIISCIAGKLAFWESDDMNYRYILHREGI